MPSEKDMLKELSEKRKHFSGLYRVTTDGGATYVYYAVAKVGTKLQIPADKYYELKADTVEVKSHEPATKEYGNIYSYSVTF